MLTDTHMFASMKLLNKAFPQLSVSQDPLLSQSTEKKQFVQILHVGGNHWITVSWDGFEGTIYDSLSDSLHRRMKRRPNFALPSEVELMVAQRVHPRSQGDEIPVVVPKVQQQTDGVSCGLLVASSWELMFSRASAIAAMRLGLRVGLGLFPPSSAVAFYNSEKCKFTGLDIL